MTQSVKAYMLTALLIICSMISAKAQSPSLTVQAPGQVIQGRNFTVTFRVTNADAQISHAPELKGCTLLYGPAVSTMVSQEYVNGRSSSTVVRDYTFTYKANQAGSVTVPSVAVNADGKQLKSPTRNITILPPDKNQAEAGGHQGGQPQSGRTAQVSANDLIVTVTMSKDHLYEQQAVIATIKVYTKVGIRSFRPTVLPSFDGFLSEELPVNEEPRIEHFRGDNYYSAVLKRCLLYPQKAGKLTINSGRYDVTVETYEEISNGFFVTRRPIEQHITTTSNSLSVNIMPLPEPKPEDFSGAVGTDFSAKVSLEPSLLRTNEAATYVYSISGTGNVKYLSAPNIDFGSGMEEYEPETETDASFNGNDMQGTFTATYTIVPQQIGELNLPARNFVYFNPSTGKYVEQELPAISRKIVKGSATSSGAVQATISDKIDDILHIKTLKSSSLSHEQERIFGSLIYLLCFIIVIAGLVTAAVVYRRQLKLNADITGRRTARANSVAVKRLRKARDFMNKHDNDGFYAAVASALWGYMGDKLGIPASALTRDNISERLASKGVSPETIKQTIDVLDACEMARFTPQHDDNEVNRLYADAENVIKSLESVKRTPVKKQ